MYYLQFSFFFFIIHLTAYIIAGAIDLQLAKKIYAGKDRLFKFYFRDMSDEKESSRIAGLMIPSQFIRAMLMSFVLYPILPFLEGLSFPVKFLFMAGLMFVYADFSSAIPFPNTIEGLVYLKKEFTKPNVFWTIQLEAVIYSLLFGILAAAFII